VRTTLLHPAVSQGFLITKSRVAQRNLHGEERSLQLADYQVKMDAPARITALIAGKRLGWRDFPQVDEAIAITVGLQRL
jgi:hypothetical protein